MAKRKVKEVRDRKHLVKRKKESKLGSYIIGGIIIFLMVASIAGVSVYNNNNNNNNNNPMEYNGHKFTVGENNLLYTYVGNKELRFRSLPEQALSISFDDQVIPVWKNATYRGILIDPTMDEQVLQVLELIRFELAQEIPNFFTAISQNSSLYTNMPVLSCDNTSREVPFLVFELPNTNTSTYENGKVSLEGGCIIIKGDLRNMLMTKDRLVYEFYDFYKVKEDG